MKKIIIIIVAILAFMEGLGWWAYRSSKKEDLAVANPSASVQVATAPDQESKPDKITPNDDSNITSQSSSNDTISGGDASSFPPPSVEMVDGITQRTIHMGVRQWAWDPSQISVNYGEKVILIMHNADVPHSIMIPDLNVNAAIPADGAVVTFMAGKRGTFDFFCAVPCGNGHSKMQGKITVV
jgi:heme/copper-type cytochrome/quinol oxidase subunit 2